jgi:hypothetical protein
MKLTIGVFLLTFGLLLPGGQMSPQDKARCLASCNKKCTDSYNSCMKNATNDSAKASCKKSQTLCGSICVNKACQ